jgi:hypothetical protein
MLLEKTVEAKCRGIAKARGGKLEKYYPPPRGRPDRILLYRGCLRFMEFKTKIGRLSKTQKLRRTELKELGFHVYVPRSTEDFIRVLDAIDENLAAVSASGRDAVL